MKIAFCLHGNTGIVYTNKHDYKWNESSQYTDYRIGYEHFKKHIFDVNKLNYNTIDVFIHNWNVEYQDGIIDIYRPKKSLFEPQINFGAVGDNPNGTLRKEFIYSRWYSEKESIRLKSEYEKENNFEYDIVFSTRFDLLFLKDLDFNSFKDTSLLYTPLNADFMPHNPRLSDLFFFSNSKNIDNYLGKLYDFILPKIKIPNANGLSSHTTSYVFAKECNLDIAMIEDYDFDKKDSIVLAREYYKNCEYWGDKYPGINNLDII
jgi:hypothetical protein